MFWKGADKAGRIALFCKEAEKRKRLHYFAKKRNEQGCPFCFASEMSEMMEGEQKIK